MDDIPVFIGAFRDRSGVRVFVLFALGAIFGLAVATVGTMAILTLWGWIETLFLALL